MSRYKINRERAITRDTTPSLTDQGGAAETDINVIVRTFGVTGQAPGQAGQPMYLDWTEMPDNLRDYIETARSADELHKQLPEQLKKIPTNELLGLTATQIAEIMKPQDQKE